MEEVGERVHDVPPCVAPPMRFLHAVIAVCDEEVEVALREVGGIGEVLCILLHGID